MYFFCTFALFFKGTCSPNITPINLIFYGCLFCKYAKENTNPTNSY